jgi:GST-like protein
MIDLYFWPTPNGFKPLIFLEEAGLEYTIKPVNILAGDQFKPDFLKIAPNNRMPALVDGDVAIFESGAILIYLAEKTGQFLPEGSGRYAALQWLMWQMAGLGPMMGQANHFVKYAKDDIPYAKQRYLSESERLLKVLNTQLKGKDYITGDYTIADMATYPWVVKIDNLGIAPEAFPHVQAWIERMGAREAVQRAYAKGTPIAEGVTLDDKAHALLFGNKKE